MNRVKSDDDFKVEENFVKRRRRRNKPNNRWTNDQTTSLLNYVLSHMDGFEKPTAQAYYKIAVSRIPILHDFEWNLLRHKIRNLKRQYQKAIDWSKTHEKIYKDPSIIKDQILKICPYWDRVVLIFSKIEKKETLGTAHYNYPFMKVDNDCTTYMEADASDDFICNSYAGADVSINYHDEDESSSHNNSDDDIIRYENLSNSSYNVRRNASYRWPDDNISNEIALQRQQIELERDKLSVKKAEMRLKQFEIEKEFEFKCKQIDSDQKLRILEMEKDERLTRYELDLKYNVITNSNVAKFGEVVSAIL